MVTLTILLTILVRVVVWIRNVPHRHIRLDIWFLASVLFWKAVRPLGGGALLEEVVLKGSGVALSWLQFSSPDPPPHYNNDISSKR